MIAGLPGLAARAGAIPRAALVDALFVALLPFAASLLYLRRLGFYSDDWAFLARMRGTSDQSLWGYAQVVGIESMQMRPVQVLYYAWLYWAFGPSPLAYHLVNTTVIAAGVALCYLAAHELAQPRGLALALALVYSFLPHYSTDRLWYAASITGLAMLLYFLTVVADARYARRGGWGWWAVGSLALVVSGLGYEVFLPLFVLHPLLCWWQLRSTAPGRVRVALWLAARNLALVAAVMLFKLATTVRLAPRTPAEQLGWFAALLRDAFSLLVAGDYGLRLPRVLWIYWQRYLDPAALAAALAVGALVALALARSAEVEDRAPRRSLLLLGLGLVIFVGGYAIFLLSRGAAITPTGINNRTAIAAAIGVAMIWVGLAGLASAAIPWRAARGPTFALLVGCACACGFLLNANIARLWGDAADRQRQLVAALQRDLPALPAGSVLLLDGLCPYLGPGIIFETAWDTSGMLRLVYGDWSLRGDVVSPRTLIHDDRVSIQIYGEVQSYPYDRLAVYHVGRGDLMALPSAAAARDYFAAQGAPPGSACPSARPGFGAPVWVPAGR